MGKKKLFWLLTSRGFGSEINNLLYAINYSKKNDYEFVLETKFWNSSYQNGWTDYFISFQANGTKTLEVKALIIILRFINRFVRIRNSNRKLISFPLNFFLKKEKKTIFWNFHEVRKFNNDERLRDRDKFLFTMNKILKTVWRINPSVKLAIENKKICLRNGYAVFHIRRGDKLVSGEDNYYPVEDYMNKLKSISSSIKTVFVMSDDYSVYTELKYKFGEYDFITLISDSKRGYDNYNFNQMKKHQKRSEIINLLAEIEIARKSKIFIGSYRSNIYRLIEYFKLRNCYNIGFKDDSDSNIYL